MSRMTKHVSKAGKVDPGDRVTLPVKIAGLVYKEGIETPILIPAELNSEGEKCLFRSNCLQNTL